MDNLSTHSLACLYEAFPPAEAHRLARRFDVHYTPKHGSWLNVAEIFLSTLSTQCLDQRVGSAPQLRVLSRNGRARGPAAKSIGASPPPRPESNCADSTLPFHRTGVRHAGFSRLTVAGTAASRLHVVQSVTTRASLAHACRAPTSMTRAGCSRADPPAGEQRETAPAPRQRGEQK
jgi:hypothetical protein